MDTRTAIRFEVYFPELLLLIELIESDGTQDSDCRWPIPYGRIFRIRDRSEKVVMFCGHHRMMSASPRARRF